MIYHQIKTLELELSSSCNSACPVCPRYVEHDGGIYDNPMADLNQHMTAEQIANILEFPTYRDVNIDCIGTVGDPMANKNIVDIIRAIVEAKPWCKLQLHTNGSLRNTKVFAQLAELMPVGSQRKIVFSVDGLRDTNHFYRVGVAWDRIMDNASTFISQGGNASWKWVKFNHNLHQIEDAKRIARRLGFQSFYTTNNQSPDELVDRHIVDGKPQHRIMRRPPTSADGYEDDETAPTDLPNVKILPQCEQGQYVHVRADGLVFPCCMTAAQAYNPSKWARDDVEVLMQMGNTNWNSLKHRSFTDIMYDPQWTQVKANYESNKPCVTCVEGCGEDMAINPPDHIGKLKSSKSSILDSLLSVSA